MKCRDIQDRLPDVALGITPMPTAVRDHLRSCGKCADSLQALCSVMSLLDEWIAPEPSPFWNVRMQALLRAEQQRASAGCLQWLRRPALSIAAALSLVAGIGFYHVGRFIHEGGNPPTPMAFNITAPAGTAVADLQYLDKYSDLLQHFDALDYLDGDMDADSTN